MVFIDLRAALPGQDSANANVQCMRRISDEMAAVLEPLEASQYRRRRKIMRLVKQSRRLLDEALEVLLQGEAERAGANGS
jgi:hypothetical protein